MARQTRRRRDNKSKNRYRPRFSSASGSATSDENLGISRKSSKVNWVTVFALIAIFIFSLYIRTAWTIEPATEDGFQLTGGSDPYYHKRVVDYVAENGEHLQKDPMLNYPYGANNNRPPLFDWSIAIIGLALSPFFSSTEESVWWAMEVLPAIYGALIIFPVYAIGKAQFGKEAGIIGAFLMGVNSQHVSHSSLALADHDSYIILFGTTAYFFFMKALTVANDKKWVSKWTDWNEIKTGVKQFVDSEKLAIGYAGLAGITITMISLSWKGFPYIMAIIAIYLGLQMLINAFRRIDSLTTAALGLITLSMPVILSYPYYNTLGLVGTWWEAPAYILLGYMLISLLMVATRDLPWLLVIGSSIGIATFVYLLLTYVFTDLGFLLFSGQGYFVRTKLFDTIAEAQPPKFHDFVFAFGPITIWLAIFGIIWMAYQLFNQSIWKKDYLFVMIWALVSIYMAQSAVRFIFNATPVVSLLSGWITWLLIQKADFPTVLVTWKAFWGKRGETFLALSIISLAIGFWLFFAVSIVIGLLSTLILLLLVMVIGHMDAQSEDQYRFRDRIGGLRKGFDLKRPIIALFVGLFIFLPNTFYGYDAGIPYEDKKEHDVDIYDFLSYDFLRPEEYDYNERNNQTLYPEGVAGMYSTTNTNQLWYMGNTGSSFPQDYWVDGLEWLAEQDTNLEPEERPGFIAWWDYGFWAIDIGEHPTVADNFQFGYQIAGNFIASQSEHEAMALLLYRLLEPEVDRNSEKFSDEIRTELLVYLSEEEVSELEDIISNPEDYIPKKADGTDQEVHKKNAAIRAGRPILMTIEKKDIADLIWEVEQITGHSIRYFGADNRLMPRSANDRSVLYAPVTLADYDIDDFYEIHLALSDGQILSFDDALVVIENNPDVSLKYNSIQASSVLVYKEKFLNSTFFRSFIGWSAPDIDRPIDDGIPGVSGALANEELPSLPGWNLTHFKLVHYNSGLRILKYYDGATVYGTITTPEGDPVANANVTVLDEYKVPHGRATTDKDGKYSVLVPAGNLTLAVSMGDLPSDMEKVFRTSNNLLVRKENIIISEAQATRQTAEAINIDLEVEPASITGRLFWDNNKDETFDSDDDSVPLIPITAENIRSEVSHTVRTDANGNYGFTDLAPGEYKITAEMSGHTLDLASYTGSASLRAKQDVTVKGALEPSAIWGRIQSSDYVGSKIVTISLQDETNNSVIEESFLNTYYHVSECTGDSMDSSISYCFNHLLPGNYTLRFESENIYTGWSNNTKKVTILEGQSRSFNATLLDGFRLEGTLTHNGLPITGEQISLRNLNEQYSDNVFTTDTGYFATVLPKGIYDIYTIHQTEQTTLAYLSRVDSQTYSSPVEAEMGPGHTIKGFLFEELGQPNGIYEPETGEKTYSEKMIRFISESGSASVSSSFEGEYEIILPTGDYNAYSHVTANEAQNLVALRDIGRINGNTENVNLSASLGFDAWILLHEEHLGEMMPLEGLVDFRTTEGQVEVWATDPLSKFSFLAGEYQVELNKIGYTLDSIYYGPDEEKIETEKFDLGKTEELIILAKRIPTSISGKFVYEGNAIANAELSFSPMRNPNYYLNFTTDENGDFINVELPPDQYMYAFSLEESGSRYLVHGQIDLSIGTPVFDMGDVSAELKYQVSGDATLDGERQNGMIILRPVNDYDNFTIIEANMFGPYSGFLIPGDYYVTFQDGLSSKHYSYGGFLELNAPTVHDVELKNEGHVKGKVTSQADNRVITDRSVRIQFISDENIVFITDTDTEDGFFGTDDNYGKIDLPNGDYDVIVTEDGYQDFTSTITIAGANPTYNDIVLTPKTVNITLKMTYWNATGSKVALANALVIFDAVETGETFGHYTDDNGEIIITDMIPKTYSIEMDVTLNDGADEFKMSKRNIVVEAGKEQQTFEKTAEWKVRVAGTVFYDRNFDGTPDSNELLGYSQLDIWNVQGTQIETSTVAEADGSYEIYLGTGPYKTWFYTTEGTSYAMINNLELDGSSNLSPSLLRGVNYNVSYQSSESAENIDFGDVNVFGENFSFVMDVDNGEMNILVPPGTYQFQGNYEDLSAANDYAYVLDRSVNITDDIDGISQIEAIEKQLMRGIEVSLDMNQQEIPLGQTTTFTFNVTSNGFLDIILETGIDEIPQNWAASFEPNKLSLSEGEIAQTQLKITPNDNVVPGVWEVFYVEIFWKDYEDNNVDDIGRNFAVTVDPIEQPEPDFTILTGDFTWDPDAPSDGTEVTLSATVTNLVNHSGSHYVPVVFYADDVAINMPTAFFDGSGDEVTVSTTWNATKGVHSLKVEIDPENAIEESNTDNNKAITTFSIDEDEEDDNSSTMKMIAVAVGLLVVGFVYISYRSRRT